MKGADAEDRALAHLQQLGHVLLARNYRIRGGEIDLVTREDETVVFTEVKQRARADFGGPLESVTPRKADLLRRAALRFLVETFRTEDVPCRFDVIAIHGAAASGRIEHVRDAF